MSRSYQCLLLYVTTFVFLDGFGKLEKFLWTAELLRLACFYTGKQKTEKDRAFLFLVVNARWKPRGRKAGKEQKDLYTCPEDFRLIMGSRPTGNTRGVAPEPQPESILGQSLPSRLMESHLSSLMGPWGQLWPVSQSRAVVAFRASGPSTLG